MAEISIFSFPVTLTVAFIALFVGFAILIKGADWLVDGSSSAAKRGGISDLAIGLTVVAFGTSMPELIVSLLSSLDGKTDASFGNAIGSNNFNILFILGVSGVIFPLAVQRNTIKYEIPLSFLAAVLLWVLVNDQMLGRSMEGVSEEHGGIMTRMDSIILLLVFSGFLFYIYRTMKLNPDDVMPSEAVAIMPMGKAVALIIAGLAMLILGGKAVVDSATGIASAFGLSEKLIGLTILAAGTSLPELATSAMAAYRKNADIAIGNVVGSNIFNILFILGITGTINPMPYDDSLNFDLYTFLGSTILLIIFMFTMKAKRLDRWEAFLFLVLYVGYTVYLIVSDPGAAATS